MGAVSYLKSIIDSVVMYFKWRKHMDVDGCQACLRSFGDIAPILRQSVGGGVACDFCEATSLMVDSFCGDNQLWYKMAPIFEAKGRRYRDLLSIATEIAMAMPSDSINRALDEVESGLPDVKFSFDDEVALLRDAIHLVTIELVRTGQFTVYR